MIGQTEVRGAAYIIDYDILDVVEFLLMIVSSFPILIHSYITNKQTLHLQSLRLFIKFSSHSSISDCFFGFNSGAFTFFKYADLRIKTQSAHSDIKFHKKDVNHKNSFNFFQYVEMNHFFTILLYFSINQIPSALSENPRISIDNIKIRVFLGLRQMRPKATCGKYISCINWSMLSNPVAAMLWSSINDANTALPWSSIAEG